MTTYIPKLARIASAKGAARKRTATAVADRAEVRLNDAALAGLAQQVRRRLAIGPSFSDQALRASLAAIARHPSHEARWRAAEASTLGQHLAAASRDARRALVTLLALLPKPYH